ncbi:hypothetical protein ABZP36_026551 [Zizania latifolia]
MASFSEAPPVNAAAGAKILRTTWASATPSTRAPATSKHGRVPRFPSGLNLNGLFGRQSGKTPGYSYSAANKNTAVIWEDNTLYDYLLTQRSCSATPKCSLSAAPKCSLSAADNAVYPQHHNALLHC